MTRDEDATARVAISRIGKACDRCRVKKVRCSGDVPCTRCSKDGTECCFGERSQKKNLSADYASLLEHQGSILEQAVKTAWQRWVPESERASLGATPSLPAIMEHLGISGPDNSNGRVVYHHDDAAGSPADDSYSYSSSPGTQQTSTSKDSSQRRSRKRSITASWVPDRMPDRDLTMSPQPPADGEADHLRQTWSPSYAIDDPTSPGAYNELSDLSFASSPTSFTDPGLSRAGTVFPSHMTQYSENYAHWSNSPSLNGISSTTTAPPPSGGFRHPSQLSLDDYGRGPSPLTSNSISSSDGSRLPIYARRPAARPTAFTSRFHIDMSQVPKVLIENQSRENKIPSTSHDTAQFVQYPEPSHLTFPPMMSR